jgi:dual specificity phosphatase, catalytic domain
MPKITVMSAEKAFLSAHYGGPFKKEDYVIVSITDTRYEADCPVVFRPVKNLKYVFRVPFIDIAADKLDPSKTVKEQTGLDLPVFSIDLAKTIKAIGDFAKKYNYHILVHCEAGVSRSQAVGACLELYVNKDASNVERRIHSGNYTYFQTFFRQFDDSWRVLSRLQKPIYQDFQNNAKLFGHFYKMDHYDDHRLPEGAFGPDYPGSHMLGLTDRIHLENLIKKG